MTKNTFYLFVIIILYFTINFFDQKYIFSDEFIYSLLRDEYPVSIVETVQVFDGRFNWISYVFIPVVILLKILFATFCVTTGAIFTNTEFTFRSIFQTVTISETVLLVSQMIFSLSLFLNRDILTSENAGNYFPLSMLSFFGTENVVSWLHYPLQTLNLFEVFYVLFISWLLSRQWKADFIESLNIVIPSYGIGLLLWMVLVVFLTLQIS